MADVTSWKSIELPQLPEEVSAAISGIAALGNTTVAALQALSTILDIVAKTTFETDPTRLVLSAAIEAIETGLNTLLEDSGVYVLFVPVRRKILISPLLQEALTATGMPAVPKDTANLDLIVLQARIAALNADAATFLATDADGGNAGFFRTVVESILDTADPNRPLFSETDYVAGIHVVAGASDYFNLLSLMTALDSLLAPMQANTTLTAPEIPVPQNLRVQMVPTLSGLPGGRVSWDPQQSFLTLPTLNASCLITEIAIIRSTNPAVLMAASPTGLFGTSHLTTGLTAPGDPDTQVVAVLDYDIPLPPSTYDDDTGLENGKTYFYFASFRVNLGDINAVFSGASFPDQGFQRLSNVAIDTARPKSARSGKGAPPDWIRTPSAISLLPQAADLMTLLRGTLAQFKAGVSGNAAALKAYLTFLQAEIARYAALTSSLAGLIQRLSSLATQTPTAGIYGRAFFGKGGTDFMLADLGASLSPSSEDVSRPPFDRGDEFVTGTVVVIGGPSEAGVLSVKTMLEVMFGLSGGVSQTPLQEAIAAIDAALSTAEDAQLGDDFTVGTATVTQSLTNPPLSDDDPGNCDHPDPITSFNDDFTPST